MDRKKQENGVYSALFLVGIVLITALFISYNNFLAPKELGTGGPYNSVIEQLKERFSNKNTQEGQIDELAATDTREGVVEVAGAKTSESTEISNWVAIDYKLGEIQSGNYTVKSGDTLWEIAEAVYGDGNQWVKILNANSSQIEYLPNGTQALIIPGQVLNVP